MFKNRDNLTIVILSETQAKEASVRHALRCIARDVGSLCKALGRHRREFFAVITRGYEQRDQWWKR
jgi:hypothetical protein